MKSNIDNDRKNKNELEKYYGSVQHDSIKHNNDRGGGSKHMLKPKPKHKPKHKPPILLLIVVDVVLAALIMLIFYITNYVIKSETGSQPLPTPSSYSSQTTPTQAVSGATTDPAQTTVQESTQATTPADPTSWRVKFADKFTNGAVEKTSNTYKSANINVSIDKVQKDGVTYYVADIYVADLKYFKSAFAKKSDVMGYREFTYVVAKENDAIIAINGDHCVDNGGPVVRNGKLYRDEKLADALVMNYDGSMQTFAADQLDMTKIKTEGAYQVWTFGPMLLDKGQLMTQFNSTITGANPRTAVGYFEPGHYCFVVVDGRQPGYSNGYTMQDLSQLFYSLGCTVAFNLDGGQSTELVFMGKIINQPYHGGRSTSDILYIAD